MAETSALKPRPPASWLNRFVRDNRDMILSMYADRLMSFKAICEAINTEIKEYSIPPSMLRFAFLSDPYLCGAYNAAIVDRAHTLAEEVLEHANKAAQMGDEDKAAAIKMKLAEKYSPRHYGQKLEPQPLPLQGGASSEGIPDSALESVVRQFQIEGKAAA